MKNRKQLEENIVKMMGRNNFKAILCQNYELQIEEFLKYAISKIELSIEDLYEIDKKSKDTFRDLRSDYILLENRHEVIIDILIYINAEYKNRFIRDAGKYIQDNNMQIHLLEEKDYLTINKETTIKNYNILLNFCKEFVEDIERNRKMMACVKFYILDELFIKE